TSPLGWLSARYGRKRVVLVSLIGFTITSTLCGAAQNLPEMVIFRFVQGAFGAALIPVSQALLYDAVRPEQRGRIVSVFAMVALLGPVIGPTLGGWLTDNFSWRWVFYVNIPIGLIVVPGVWLTLRDHPNHGVDRFDAMGFIFFSIALAALQLML